ncbi:MAG: VWA domain-containing protein [Planctomycetales bacterium]|nr:VWA domain-containing protein [Planctomycetales bacterium]
MEIPCQHCGQRVRIEPDQLGKPLGCPACRQPLRLPSAAGLLTSDAVPNEPHDAPPHPRGHWWENSLSTLASVVFHASLLLIFALISYGKVGVPNDGEEVSIGALPETQLEDATTELSAEAAQPEADQSDTNMALEIEAPVSLADTGGDPQMELAPSASALGGGDLDLGSVGLGGSMAGGGSWEGMLQNLRRNGLDVVIAFDSTSSMSGEINQVKSQIERIGKSLLKLVPQARIGLCTYRDHGDAYLVRGVPLTNNVQQLVEFLNDIRAGGGGDGPEAVEAGIAWAMDNNEFRSRARKVILVFGDAPPHDEDLSRCLQLASDFARRDGIVSTVTCRRRRPLPEFVQISQAGEGEAFLTTDERQIMSQLLVLVFGAQFRAKVLEAFGEVVE